MNRLAKHLAPVLSGSWIFVVGAVALAACPIPYRAEVPAALSAGVGSLISLRR